MHPPRASTSHTAAPHGTPQTSVSPFCVVATPSPLHRILCPLPCAAQVEWNLLLQHYRKPPGSFGGQILPPLAPLLLAHATG